MTSQGQRFRRRSLRRGYKVDEVDSFLDRVEATLNGDRIDAPVRAQEVHDVVFRVRFGGYDEWQVDLHLDRLERQLADQEPGADFAEERVPDRMPGDDRMAGSGRMAGGMPDRMAGDRMSGERMSGERMSGGGRDDRMMPPMRDDRMMPPASERPPLPTRPMQPSIQPINAPAPAAGYPPRYDEPTYGGAPNYPAAPNYPTAPGARPAGPGHPGTASRPSAPPGYGSDPGYGGDPGYGTEPTYGGGYDASRHGRMDMTTEMRVPDSTAGSASAGDLQRIDQLRRGFQLRRFGSGYDRMEVDRLFEGIMSVMSGRSSMPVNESELDPQQFSLVPGGYFEAEVDQALREVREIFRRR